MSFPARMIGLVVFASTLSALLVGASLLYTSRTALLNARMGELLSTGQIAAEVTSDHVAGALDAARDLAKRPEVTQGANGGGPGQSRGELERALTFLPWLHEIALSEVGGNAVTVSRVRDRAGTASVAGERDVLDVLRTGQPAIGTPTRSSVTGQLIVPYSVPVQDREGRLLGVLRVGIAVDMLTNTLSGLNRGREYAYLVDLRNGVVVSHPDEDRIGQPALADDEPAARLLAGARDVRGYAAGPTNFMFAALAEVPSAPWGVVIAQPVLADGGPIIGMAWRTIVLTILTVVGTGTLAAWLAVGMTGSLRRLHRAVNAFASRRIWQRADISGNDEIADLGRAFDGMAASIAAQVAELERSRQLILASEERQRSEIAEFLHSRVQSRLLVAAHHLAELERRDVQENPAHARALLALARVQVDEVREQDIRQASHLLHPSIIRFGLVPALESLADSASGPLDVALEVEDAVAQLEGPTDNPIPEDLRLAVYRIVQDALSNALRHGEASKVTVSLRLARGGPDQPLLELAVSDDGRGFDPARTQPGLGLSMIAARASQFGGSWHIDSAPGRGTTLAVRFHFDLTPDHTRAEPPPADGVRLSRM